MDVRILAVGIFKRGLVEVFLFSARVSGQIDCCLQPEEVDILRRGSHSKGVGIKGPSTFVGVWRCPT
jgi:hypothetical protein